MYDLSGLSYFLWVLVGIIAGLVGALIVSLGAGATWWILAPIVLGPVVGFFIAMTTEI